MESLIVNLEKFFLEANIVPLQSLMGINQSLVLGLSTTLLRFIYLFCFFALQTATTSFVSDKKTCHSSASLVTLPVEVVDSGPEPGGRELNGGIELGRRWFLMICLYRLTFMIFLCDLEIGSTMRIRGHTCIPFEETLTIFPRV